MLGSSSRLFRASLVLLGCVLLALGAFPAAAQKPSVKFFDETRHNLRSPYLEYWQEHNGAFVLGAPITEAVDRTPSIQYFQRGRLEQKENGTVVASNLGVELGYSRSPEPLPPRFVNDERQLYVRETGHFLRDAFLRYYLDHGAAGAFGYPISSMELDGTLIVQYFQRAIFEWNPRETSPSAQMKLRAIGLIHFARSNMPMELLQPAEPQATVFAGATVRVATLVNRPAVVTPTLGADMIAHRVTWGETWLSIAQKYGVAVDDLLKANAIEVVRPPYVGQDLRIPRGAAPTSIPPAATSVPATSVPATSAPATPVPTVTAIQARSDPGPVAISLAISPELILVPRGRPQTFLITARDTRGQPTPNVEVAVVVNFSGGHRIVQQVLTDRQGEARVAAVIPGDQAIGMVSTQVQTVQPGLVGTAYAWFVVF